MQLSNVTRWKLELATFLFIKDPCNALEFWHTGIKKLVEIEGTLNVKVSYYWQEMRKHKYIFLLARFCKQIIWKSSG